MITTTLVRSPQERRLPPPPQNDNKNAPSSRSRRRASSSSSIRSLSLSQKLLLLAIDRLPLGKDVDDKSSECDEKYTLKSLGSPPKWTTSSELSRYGAWGSSRTLFRKVPFSEPASDMVQLLLTKLKAAWLAEMDGSDKQRVELRGFRPTVRVVAEVVMLCEGFCWFDTVIVVTA